MTETKTKTDEQLGELGALDFSTFVLSLSSSVLMCLGVVENPVTKKIERTFRWPNRPLTSSRFSRKRQRGNLTDDGTRLLDDVLHELRVLYCKAIA